MLVRIKAKLGKAEHDKLRQFISSTIDDANETGWEEMTLASVQHLIKLNMASIGQGAASASQMTVTKMQDLEDISKLRSGMAVLFEALVANGKSFMLNF